MKIRDIGEQPGFGPLVNAETSDRSKRAEIEHDASVAWE